MVKQPYRLPHKGKITNLVIDSTGLKVLGEGEWKVRKHGPDKRRVWRKQHLPVDPAMHDIVAAEVSLKNVHDDEVMNANALKKGAKGHTSVAWSTSRPF